MRVVAGRLKGLKLLGPPRNAEVRPTEDRVREALFSTLGPPPGGVAFLDLCAGTGAVGLEAWSRGFASVTFVERDKTVAAVTRRNMVLALERGATDLHLLPLPLDRALGRLTGSYRVAFCDPPYAMVDEALVVLLAEKVPLDEGGILVVESRGKQDMPDRAGPLSLLRRSRYGCCALSYYRREP